MDGEHFLKALWIKLKYRIVINKLREFIIILLIIFYPKIIQAEEIKLSCKGKHNSKEFQLGKKIKEIIYEEDLLYDTSKKKLFWINIRQFNTLNDGTTIEAHKPLVFRDLTPSNLIQFYDENENTITFANAYLNNKLYSMKQFLKLDLSSVPSSTTLATYFYAIDKKTLDISKQLQTESASLPMINFRCIKIN